MGRVGSGDAVSGQLMYLGGCTFSVYFSSQAQARDAVTHLATCHGHHFAVTGEGLTVSMSEMAVSCLHEADLLGPTALIDDLRIEGE